MSCFGVPYTVANVDEVRDEDSFLFQKICDGDGVNLVSVKQDTVCNEGVGVECSVTV